MEFVWSNGTEKYNTWSECNFAWGDNPMSLKTWAGLYNSVLSLSVSNIVQLQDELQKKIISSYIDSITLHDDNNSQFNKVIINNVLSSCSLSKLSTFYRDFIELASIEERLYKTTEKNINEDLTGQSNIAKGAYVPIENHIRSDDFLNREAKYHKQFTNVLLLADDIGKKENKNMDEVITAFDRHIRSLNAVISSFIIDNHLMTFESFRKSELPAGYTAFRDFVIGDYQYKEAIFKTQIEGAVTSGRAGLTEWTVNIDVPDTIEKGTVSISTEGTEIKFSKRFYEAPEMMFLLRSDTEGSIKYDVTSDGFKIWLVKDNKYIEGVASWCATGF